MRAKLIGILFMYPLMTQHAAANCLEELAKFAQSICGELSKSGSKTFVTANGKLTAETQSLISRVLGQASGDINGQYVTEQYENVIRENLPDELKDNRKCRQRMVEIAHGNACVKKETYKTCRHSDFGIEGWGNTEILNGSTGWRGGGYNQDAWCSDYSNSIVRARGIGQGHYKISVLAKSEEGRWTGRFNRDRQYNYHCKIELSSGPIYKEKQDPRCGIAQ